MLGNSVGGFASARLAARRPARVRALVLVDSGGFTQTGCRTRFFCWAKGRVWIRRRLEGAFARHYLRTRNEHAAAILRTVDGMRLRPEKAIVHAAIWRSFSRKESQLGAEAGKIQCPVLLVWGRHDPVLPIGTDGRAARRALPSASGVETATGHCPFAEAPREFLAAALPFLSPFARDGMSLSP